MMSSAIILPDTNDEAINYAPPSIVIDEDYIMFQCMSTMLKQEKHYNCPNYLRLKCSKASMNSAITAACRAKMCRWIFHTAGCAKFHSETAITAITLLDRFAASASSARARKTRNSHEEYQLVALSALFIAIKITEQIEIDASTMCLFMKDVYSAEDIIFCEKDILGSLQWKLNGPTPLQFIRCVLDVLPDSEAQELQGESQRQIEMAIEDSACVILQRSSLAIAAILNTLDDVPQEVFPSLRRAKFIQVLSGAFGLDVLGSPLIKAVRMRLLHVCSIDLPPHQKL